MAQKKPSIVERLYPSKTIGNGDIEVTIKPLTIGQLPRVVELFEKFTTSKLAGKTDMEIIKDSIRDILSVIELCVDKSLDEIPADMAPEIASVFLRQNFGADVLGKWSALGDELTALFPAPQSQTS